MPVMIAGRAIGRMNQQEIASRPKEFWSARFAAAHSVPSCHATAVEIVSTRTDNPRAFPDIGRSRLPRNHFRRQPRRWELVALCPLGEKA